MTMVKNLTSSRRTRSNDFSLRFHKLNLFFRAQEEEMKKLGESMMTKKKKKMYNMIQHGQEKQREKANTLLAKREKLKRVSGKGQK